MPDEDLLRSKRCTLLLYLDLCIVQEMDTYECEINNYGCERAVQLPSFKLGNWTAQTGRQLDRFQKSWSLPSIPFVHNSTTGHLVFKKMQVAYNFIYYKYVHTT